jgi:hypothetical protein
MRDGITTINGTGQAPVGSGSRPAGSAAGAKALSQCRAGATEDADRRRSQTETGAVNARDHRRRRKVKVQMKHENSRTGGCFHAAGALMKWVVEFPGLCALVGGLVFLIFSGSLRAEDVAGYAATGRLDVKIKRLVSDPGKDTSFQFTAEVQRSSYKLHIWRAGQDNIYWEYYFDGQKLYSLYHLTNSTSTDSSLGKSWAGQRTLYPLIIDEREIPPNDGTRAQFIWFALASGHYFEAMKNGFMPPIWNVEDPSIRRQPFDMRVSVERLDQRPRLPSFVAFINDGYYREFNPSTGENVVIALKPPFDKGYTNAYYQALEYTNIGPIVVPQKFIFVAYSAPLGTGVQPFDRWTINGTVETANSTADHRLSLSADDGVASVTDYTVHGQTSKLPPQTMNTKISLIR